MSLHDDDRSCLLLNRRRLLGASAALAVGTPLLRASAQTPVSDRSGSLVAWGFGAEETNPMAYARIQAFQEAFPNLKIELVPQYDDQKLLTAVASGNVPDLIWMSRWQIASWVARDVLMPLSNYFDDGTVDRNEFYPAALDDVTIEDTIYGLPQFMDVRALYVNNDLVTEAGTDPTGIDTSDWDSLDALGQSLVHKNGDVIDRWGFDHKMQADYLWLWAKANGGSLMSEDGTQATFAEEKNVEALEWGKNVYENQGGMQAYEGFASTWQGDEQFARGQVGMTMYENWMMGIIARVNPSMNFSVLPVKQREGDAWVSFTGGSAWVVPNGANDPDGAWEFMRFMANPETWMIGAQAVKKTQTEAGASYIPSLTGNQTVDQREIDELYEPISEAYDAAVQMWPELLAQSASLPLVKSPVGADVADALKNDAVLPVLRGEKEAEDGLEDANDAAEQANQDL
jgi:multiple sugar transport system substrate-binding protein